MNVEQKIEQKRNKMSLRDSAMYEVEEQNKQRKHEDNTMVGLPKLTRKIGHPIGYW